MKESRIEDLIASLPSLSPSHFVSLEKEIFFSEISPLERRLRKKYQLPDISFLLSEEPFAEGWIAWNEEGLFVDFLIHQPFEEACYPDFEKGDAIELFLDTRDLKTAGFATRFCHHFLFLPKEIQGIQCQEVTRFRTEDVHPLCDPKDLELTVSFEKNGYKMQIFLPQECLYGYDPLRFDRLGFAYHIHRKGGRLQPFSLSEEHFNLAQHPKLWPSFHLRKT